MAPRSQAQLGFLELHLLPSPERQSLLSPPLLSQAQIPVLSRQTFQAIDYYQRRSANHNRPSAIGFAGSTSSPGGLGMDVSGTLVSPDSNGELVVGS